MMYFCPSFCLVSPAIKFARFLAAAPFIIPVISAQNRIDNLDISVQGLDKRVLNLETRMTGM